MGKAILELLRFSLSPTVVVDVTAGFFLVPSGSLGNAVAACMAALCLFCGGMALNARIDLEFDRATRPLRPLPSGRVAPALASTLAIVGLCAPPVVLFLCPVSQGRPMSLWTLLMAFLIAVYHFAGPFRESLGPSLLGAIRGMDILLGSIAAQGGAVLASEEAVVPATLYGVYVAGAALVASQEDRVVHTSRVRNGVLLAVVSSAAVSIGSMGLLLTRDTIHAGHRTAAGLGIVVLAVLQMRGLWPLLSKRTSSIGSVETIAGRLLSRMTFLTAMLCLSSWQPASILIGALAILAVRRMMSWIPPT